MTEIDNFINKLREDYEGQMLLQENKHLRNAQPIKRKVGRPKKEDATTINYVCCKPEIESYE
jgi:hypothetical protein